MPSKRFRMLIRGPSGSGKTNALIHMLLNLLSYYDKFFFMLRIYQLLSNELNKLTKKNKFSFKKIYEYSNNEIKYVDELENKLQR